MFTFLGIACVAWTTFEVHRLASASRATSFRIHSAGPIEARPRFERFAAWDDRGRPISVEDLGRP